MMSHNVGGVGVGGLSCAGRQSGASQKAQKGWLSRWTRKQWSRHWFVLKTGSLTYYRGPAAELCSFLDGVLDLSLIKHIEVQQPATSAGNSPSDLLASSNGASGPNSGIHHHHSNNNQQQQGQPQFTFSLKMWNGECHLLGAASAAERSLWLEAINACTNEDDAATDSASSSDSSPTSNLSGKSIDIGRPLISRHYLNSNSSKTQQQQQEQQLSLDLALTIKSAIKRREQQQQQQKAPLPPDVVVVERQQSQKHSEFTKTATMTALQPIKHSISANLTSRNIKASANGAIGSSQQQLVNKEPARSKQQHSSQTPMANSTISNGSNINSNAKTIQQQDQSQALKRRLVCVNARNSFELNELKLAGRKQAPADLFRKRLCAGDQPHKVATRVSSESSGDDDDDDGKADDDHVEDSEDSRDEEEECGDDDDEDDEEEEDDDDEEEDEEEEDEEKGEDQEEEEEANEKQDDAGEDKLADQRQSEKLDSISRCPTIAEQAVKNFLKKSSLLSSQPAETTTTAMIVARTQTTGLAASGQQRQKKRVTFDLSRSSQHQLTSSSESSASSDDSDESSLSPSSSVSSSEDEAEVLAKATPTVTVAISAAASSTVKQQQEVAAPNNNNNSSSSTCKLDHQSPARREMELEADEELETSGELVRSFIERRKLRLLNKEGATTATASDANAHDDGASCISQPTLQLASSPSSTSSPPIGMEGVQFNESSLSSDVIDSKPKESCSSSPPPKALLNDLEKLESSMSGDAKENQNQSRQQLAGAVDELKSKLEQAQTSICLLERKLTSSYASYGQLEMSYKRLQGELSECEQLHRASLASVQGRVDELSGELAASELKLAEARQKVLRYEQHLARRPSPAQLRLAASQAKALNWLRANQQLPLEQPGASFEHRQHAHQSQQQGVTTTDDDNKDSSLQSQQQLAVPHHQPLLLMQHVKHTLAANSQQATLGLKLLNHSKQIQRKLNELELKVDKIHHRTSSGCNGSSMATSNVGAAAQDTSGQGPATTGAATTSSVVTGEGSIAPPTATGPTTTSLVN